MGGDCAPPRRTYPVAERWGLIWIFNGPAPLFDLPAPPEGEPCRVFRLPRQRIRCHPHLVIANGLDVSHYASLHDVVWTETPHFTAEGPHRLALELRGRPASRLHRLLAGCETRDVAARFTTIGASLAWVTVREPVRFHALFSGRPAPAGGCETQTLLFLPRRGAAGVARAAAILYLLLRDDRRILDGLRFTPNFTEADMPLSSFAQVVNSLETW
jgi:phenylpropionate dioxygenase-like ring-hydroxylating dioxygenase large terminal subunit